MADVMSTVSGDLITVTDDGRKLNVKEISCQYCGSKILLSCKAELVNKPVSTGDYFTLVYTSAPLV